MLLDEPFSQIDNFKKNSLRRNLFGYLKEKNIACIIATHDGNDALSFTDKLIVIKNQQVIANDSPKEIYKNPKEKYIASLFDDVNEITINNETFLVYPHQIKVVEKSENYTKPAKVLNSYFKGSYWLIEVEFENQKMFFNHSSDLEKRKNIYLNFKT